MRARLLLTALLVIPVATLAIDVDIDVDVDVEADDQVHEPLGPPPIYEELREARLEHAGRIRDGRLRTERFEFELTDGHLYLLAPVAGRVTAAVFLGDGQVRFYPPDAVERHQLEKFLDADYLEESFDRIVFRFSDETADRLRALANPAPEVDVNKANDLLEDRREELLERQLINRDSRLVADLLAAQADINSGGIGNPSPQALGTRGYFVAEVDGKDHDWFTLQVEPRDLEEVQISRFNRGLNIRDVWSSFHALDDFTPGTLPDPFTAPPPKRETSDAADNDGRDAAPEPDLPTRPAEPDQERWSAPVRVPTVDVDLALDGNGEAKGTTALVIEALRPMVAVRLNISPVLEVTDVRWAPRQNDVGADEPARPDHAEEAAAAGPSVEEPDPSDPEPLSGEPLHFVQEKHDRRFSEDLYEPWVTVKLPRLVDRGERFTLELAYEGKLVARVRSTQDFFLRDTLNWYPRHADARRSSLRLTFRIPERYQVASGGTLMEDRVEGRTRIVRWVLEEPVHRMAFHYGRFDVSHVRLDGVPPIAVYANRNHLGFAPGNREKTIEDLASSIRVYSDYFGPFPFASLVVTETPGRGGQAFPGFLLLSYQTFGELHTGEAELFRLHETAHQWWGSAVDWDSYRDQWLSEGFAQYAAALYVLVGRDEESQFRDMLEAWRLDVLGEVNVGQGLGLRHYGFRPQDILESDGSDSGPLVVGFRLNSTKTPRDYRLLIYEKGAYVLHMLRMMLTDFEKNDDRDENDDERFRRMMRRFANDHLDHPVTTRSFEAAVTRAFNEPMDWFFDQWVYGVDVPTYRPDLAVVPTGDSALPFALRGCIAQEDVPEDFRMPVPIRVTFDDQPPMVHRVWVEAARVDVDLPLPARPSEIEFNYLNAVLARVR